MIRSAFKRISVTFTAILLGALFAFPAHAEFTSTDSTRLNNVKTNTDTIVSNTNTIKSDTATVKTNTNTIVSKLTSMGTQLGHILDQATNIEENTDEIKRALSGDSSPLIQIKDTLVGISNKIDNLKINLDILPYLYAQYAEPICQTSSSYTFTWNNSTYTIPLKKINIMSDSTYYVNFRGQIMYYLNALYVHFTHNYAQASDASSVNTKVVIENGLPVRLSKTGFYTYSYNPDTDVISNNISYKYYTFYGYLRDYLTGSLRSYIVANIAYYADTWYRYYNPRVVPESNYFWYAYNTDTQQYDPTNLAGLMQYITWYLGQMYVLQTENEALEQLQDSVDQAATTFEDLNQKEQDAIDRISSGFDTFLPDESIFSSFAAITWCSNYLQRVYLSLGSYGTVIFVALLFGVCLQFIGYFRYK